jgi:hypothetical protein
MPLVFLSYSRSDHFFAELASIKLDEAGVTLWRDQGQLRAGEDWRGGIERGINDSIAVLVALSQEASQSPYVAFEWAYGLGKGKTVIPLRLQANVVPHPRLEPIQQLDFYVPGALPWNLLIERILEIEGDATTQSDLAVAVAATEAARQDPAVMAIISDMTQRGYQIVSFERIRSRIDPALTDEKLELLIKNNPNLIARATLKEGRPGLKRVWL